MHDPVPHQELQEVRNEVKKMGLLVEKLLSCREADQNLEMSGANSLLRKEMADLKEENGKLKEEQLRAAAAAAAAEKNRLAQLAAQTKTHSVQMEKLEQALAELRARLEETITQMKAKNAEIKRLVDQREAAAQKYCTPNKQLESKQEDGSDDGFYRDYNFDDESSVDPADPKTLAHLTWLAQTSSKKKSKQQVKLHKRQGATPLAHQSPVSGRPRSRDQVEPTGQTPEQLKIRSKMEERPEDRWDHYLPSARMPAPGQTKSD
jgi:chromosome segregation ATPase